VFFQLDAQLLNHVGLLHVQVENVSNHKNQNQHLDHVTQLLVLTMNGKLPLEETQQLVLHPIPVLHNPVKLLTASTPVFQLHQLIQKQTWIMLVLIESVFLQLDGNQLMSPVEQHHVP